MNGSKTGNVIYIFKASVNRQQASGCSSFWPLSVARRPSPVARRLSPFIKSTESDKQINMIKVLGIKIIDRIKEAGLTQEVLSRHSSVITTRLGFHEVTDEVCSREAYIILHLSGDPLDSKKLIAELKEIPGIEIREMVFAGSNKIPEKDVNTGLTEILGILMERSHDVIRSVQKLLTAYGCVIRTRLGVNEMFFGEPAGLIILELTGDKKQRDLLEKDLKALEQIRVKKMVF